MTTAISHKHDRNRLALLTFLPTGIAVAAVTRSVIPMLAAGFVISVATLVRRGSEEERRLGAGVVVFTAVAFVVGIALAAYAGK